MEIAYKAWQKVILRNYGMAPTAAIAQAICCDKRTVEQSAVLMGLGKISYNPAWREKGFVSIIRNNWDILPLGDIATLLGKSEEELGRLLKEYDFLGIKLGDKPHTQSVKYSPLTEEEANACEYCRAFIEPRVIIPVVKPFEFFVNSPRAVYFPPENCEIADRFTSMYCADYGDALSRDGLPDYSDEALSRLAATGINGIWLHERLCSLAEFPFAPELSRGFETRIKNLHKLTRRAARHGLGVYLYLNEPRSLPPEFFDSYPNLRGQKCADGYCLCTSAPEVKEYLYNAVRSIAERVPDLRGVLTITMSENPTHCRSNRWEGEEGGTSCPRCAVRGAEEIAAEINNIFCRALRDGNGHTRLIANLWGWSSFMGWSIEMAERGVRLLERDVEVMCVSEYSKKFVRGGVESEVIDYSISVVGPSEFSQKLLRLAKEAGHRTWAKIQLNNSWECAGVPYIPAFGLMLRHVAAVKKLGVDGLMTGWSLGGFPGGALPLCNMACGENFDEGAWYDATFGECAEHVRKCTRIFDEAFAEFPFSVQSLYFGAHNLACANLWNLERDERKSTMVCFTFDDYENWSAPYGLEVYTAQMSKLAESWGVGVAEIKRRRGNAAYEEFKRVAEVCHIHFANAAAFASFTALKCDARKNADKLLALVQGEEERTARLYELTGADAKIGYEATNHYFYNANSLLEKLVNLHNIRERIRKIAL